MKNLKNELKSVLENKGVKVKSIRFFDYSTPELKISIDWTDSLKVREFTKWNGFNLKFCF